MNRREFKFRRGRKAAALWDGLKGCPFELRINARDLWTKFDLAFDVSGLAEGRLRALEDALSALVGPGIALSSAGRLGLRVRANALSGVWVERFGAAPERVDCPLKGRRSRTKLKRLKFRRGLLGEPALDAALAALDRLHPVAEVFAEDTGVTFALRRPIGWPMFARLDLARAFEAAAAALDERLCDRAVSALALKAGALEVSIT